MARYAYLLQGWPGIPRDEKSAISWAEKALRSGESYIAAFCYYTGSGVKMDVEKALGWYTKAIEHGFANAQVDVVMDIWDAHGLRSAPTWNEKEWFMKAAEEGYASAQLKLGYCYYSGDGVRQDREKAAELYIKAANQGLARGQYLLSLCYKLGTGVRKDEVKAMEWLTKAAEQGEESACDAMKEIARAKK